ncbi:uncharacterized protein [Diadema antillarum]|uniref:uncharacterized protein n=1 Tax=Diadema antillarum TaxID=105358 RepID=UPI003A8B3B89
MLPEHTPHNLAATGGEMQDTSRWSLLQHISDNVIGGDATFTGPFGEKQVFYCDYTASGKQLRFIEDFLTRHVLPLYANTHTTTTITSRQTTQYRHEARDIIKQCTNCGEDDAVIFTGSGSTGAIHKLINVMEMKGERARNTVVLVGPFEHHSNILPWKEIGAQVVRVQQTSEGLVDLEDIENKLKIFTQTHAHVLGCFSAASNVTGIITDTHAVSALLHRYNALSFWDYATAAPYLDIDMNPSGFEHGTDCSKDAVFVSTHKFVGGVGTPGILIAKKKLFVNNVPHALGGGTVHYVSRNMHHYLKDIEAREEGGTPAIVESIRAGLAFQVKQAVGPKFIEDRENELARRAFARWQHNENLIVLGSHEVARLPIFSFLVRHPQTDKLLHHNFIAVLLNDLFGIQARGGCACAGPYAHDLLGISEENAMKFFELIREDRKNTCNEEPVEGVRPGFVRINLPYFAPDDVIDYVLTAVDLVATHGWKMLTQYHHDVKTGSWTHRSACKGSGPGYLSLFDISYRTGLFQFEGANTSVTSSHKKQPLQLQDYLNLALEEFEKAASGYMAFESLNDEEVCLDDYQQFLWFLQPFEAASFLMASCWEDYDTVSCGDKSSSVPESELNKSPANHGFASNQGSNVHPYTEEVAMVPADAKPTRTPPIAPVMFGRVPPMTSSYYDDTAVVPDEDSVLNPAFQESLYMYGGDSILSSVISGDWHKAGHVDEIAFIKGIDDRAAEQVDYNYQRAYSHESGYSTEEDVY